MHHSIELFHKPTLMHNFLYQLTICLLHYYPRHVSSINMPIFRRKNCIHTASGIFALCKRLHSTLVESGMQLSVLLCMFWCSRLLRCSCTIVQYMFVAVRSQPVYCADVKESEDTRRCVNIIFPPEDGHVNVRNMSRIIV